MSDTPAIEERENGPLVVKGLSSMKNTDGSEIDTKPIMALCRCGASKSKPFCDGSHKEAGFESRGGTPAGRDRIITYEGSEPYRVYRRVLSSYSATMVSVMRLS